MYAVPDDVDLGLHPDWKNEEQSRVLRLAARCLIYGGLIGLFIVLVGGCEVWRDDRPEIVIDVTDCARIVIYPIDEAGYVSGVSCVILDRNDLHGAYVTVPYKDYKAQRSKNEQTF